MSTTSFIESQILSIQTSLKVAYQQLTAASNAGDSVRVSELNAYIDELNQSLTTARAKLQQAQQDDALSTASAGNLVSDDAKATVPNSKTQSPESGPLLLNADGRIESPPDTNSSSNAEPYTFLENADTGLDDPVRKIEETQSTSLGDNEQGGP